MTRGPRWHWLGTVSHARAVADQERVRDRVLAGHSPGEVLLCEHPPTITLGRLADRQHVVADEATLTAGGVTLQAASRGGDVTYHGPGQLMIYAVVRVQSALAHLRTIGEVIAATAAAHGITDAAFARDPAGVWCGGYKLAACGIHLRRGVALHGYAFDIATPASTWALINPCGLGRPGRSLRAWCEARGLPAPPPVASFAAEVGPLLCARLAAPPAA